jgi:outer membrane protein, heavy metal efflux system
MKNGLSASFDVLVHLTRNLALAAAAAALCAVVLVFAWPVAAHAQAMPAQQTQSTPAWPHEALVTEALQRTPMWQAALERHRAEQARAGVAAANPNEWTPSAAWGRRQASGEAGAAGAVAGRDVTSREWSLGLSRGVRLPAKAEAARAMGAGQQVRADAELSLAWRELTQRWLDDVSQTLQASQQAQQADAQLALWTQQRQAVARRQALGDAARQEVLLLDAAVSQAQAMRVMAAQRWLAAQGVWRSRYPGLPCPVWVEEAALPPQPLLSPGTAPSAMATLSDGSLDDALLDRHPQSVQARAQAEALEAQARWADTERHPDPTLGVQLGRERSGTERLLGLSVSWPLGGEVRAGQARALWADAQAARAQQAEVSLQLRQQWQQWRADVGASEAAWRATAQALVHARQAAQAIRKGYELGEGSLSEVILLQRQWLEQQQATAQAALDAQRARLRWALETEPAWAWSVAAPASAP